MTPPIVHGLTVLPALYLHIPFCDSKCDYCDFFSQTKQDPGLQLSVIRQTLLQMDFFLQQLDPRGIDTVYIGGGTPNSLAPDVFEYLIEQVADKVKPLRPKEWTVELNPERINGKQLALLESAGVSRLSIGIQSFSENTLTFLGRKTTAERNFEALELIGRNWTGQWNMDLIISVPGENRDTAIEDAVTAMSFHPDHLSVYNLTIEPGTPLYTRLKRKEFTPPSSEDAADTLRRVWNLLKKRSFQHYEISNFSRPGCSSRHNLHYWRMHPYLGVGPGAVSTLPSASDKSPVRITVTRDFNRFLDARFSTDDIIRVGADEILSSQEFLLEYLMMGLRTNPGIHLGEFFGIFQKDLGEIIPQTIKKAVERKLLVLHEAQGTGTEHMYISPTEEGMMILDTILLWAAIELEDMDVEIRWPPRSMI